MTGYLSKRWRNSIYCYCKFMKIEKIILNKYLLLRKRKEKKKMRFIAAVIVVKLFTNSNKENEFVNSNI